VPDARLRHRPRQLAQRLARRIGQRQRFREDSRSGCEISAVQRFETEPVLADEIALDRIGVSRDQRLQLGTPVGRGVNRRERAHRHGWR
jgi:hypothetical protein